MAVSAASEKDRLFQSASDSALVQTCEKSKQQGGHHHANAITIVGNVTTSVRDSAVFFFAEEDPIISEQGQFLAEQG